MNSNTSTKQDFNLTEEQRELLREFSETRLLLNIFEEEREIINEGINQHQAAYAQQLSYAEKLHPNALEKLMQIGQLAGVDTKEDVEKELYKLVTRLSIVQKEIDRLKVRYNDLTNKVREIALSQVQDMFSSTYVDAIKNKLKNFANTEFDDEFVKKVNQAFVDTGCITNMLSTNAKLEDITLIAMKYVMNSMKTLNSME